MNAMYATCSQDLPVEPILKVVALCAFAPPPSPTCPQPTPVSNGRWSHPSHLGSKGFAIGQTATLTCAAGYVNVGPSTMACIGVPGTSAGAEWGDGFHQCTEVTAPPPSPSPAPPWGGELCASPPAVAGGSWSVPADPFTGNSYLLNERVTLTCAAGYISSPPNPAIVTCGPKGQWLGACTCNPAVPSHNECTAPYSVPHGKWGPFTELLGQRQYGASVSLSCDAGYTVRPTNAHMQCDHGHWTTLPRPLFGEQAECVAEGVGR
jgi:hypothetical protein